MMKQETNFSERKILLLAIVSALSAGILLIANLGATKLWDFCGIAVDGGIIVFPISYLLGDLVVEVFGRKLANRVAWISLAINILAVVSFWIVGALPAFEGWDGQEAYNAILGFIPRIIAGSLLAYLSSQLLNNLIFEKIKEKTGDKNYPVRALGSSMLAHLVDSAIFETVAFIGVLPFGDFVAQAVFAYVAGIGLEIILTPLSTLVVKLVKEKYLRRVAA